MALQQFDSADRQDDDGPGAPDAERTHVIEQEQNAEGEDYDRAHDVLGAATLALAGNAVMAEQPPSPGEEPAPEKDQNKWPKIAKSKFKYADGVQQEQNAQADQDQRSDRNLGSIDPFAGAKALGESEWIGGGLAHLDGVRRAHRIDDLVDVEKSDTECEQHGQAIADGAHAPDQHGHDHQVRESLGVLAGIDGTDAEGKESGEDSSQRGIGPGAGVSRYGHSSGSDRSHGCDRHHRRRRNDAGGGRNHSRQALGQAIFAEDSASHLAGAGGAQRLSAGAAIGHCCSVAMRGAVHTNLLIVVTDTAGGASGAEASTGWFSSRL